jgi:L-lactate dehydrogenase complex protein LldE
MARAFLACVRVFFMPEAQPRVGLFVTCLVDLMRPSVGFAAIKLLEAAGCKVEVPRLQTCCGQPAYNSGDRKGSERFARQVIEAFSGFDHVVAPSGSCAGMLKVHYPQLFDDDPTMRDKAAALAEKVHELVSFLVDVRGFESIETRHEGTVAYHDSCSGLRELGIHEQPRALLRKVEGLKLVELADGEACCGFGGTFCVKYSDISNAMVERKTADIAATGADLVLAGDLGCLLNMAGKLKRQGSGIEARHVAEVLADMTDAPAIGSKRFFFKRNRSRRR